MTDATPLASEQITQEDRDEAHAIAVSWDAGRYDEAGSIVARHRIAALSATPAPSGQEVVHCKTCGERMDSEGIPCADCAFSARTATPPASGVTVPEGMKAWNGGESAPEDWDGGRVLFRDGKTGAYLRKDGGCWSHRVVSPDDIIAYTPKPAALSTPSATPGGVGNDKAWQLSWRIDRIREDGGPLSASDKSFLVETVNWMRALPATATQAEDMVRDMLSDLAAAPAPSDQDASQAQGEVWRSDDCRARGDAYEDAAEQLVFELSWELEEAALSQSDLVTVNREKLRTIAKRILERAALSPAPGATAQDGVERHKHVLNRIVVAHNRLRRSEITPAEFDAYALGLLVAGTTPTPTISAGMVAVPSAEEIAQAIKATEYKYFGDYEMSDGQREAVDVLVRVAQYYANTPLAAAPTPQAPVGQEVELPPVPKGEKRAFKRCYTHKRVGYYDYLPYSLSNPVSVMPCGCDAKSARTITEAEALASLNPTTGAGETEGGK